jgi:stage II sporulation protein E
MGSGKEAFGESLAVIDMFQQLCEVGFDSEKAIRSVKSMMMLNSRVDSCLTLDVLDMDLNTGRAVFSKLGAGTTYLQRKTVFEGIRSSALPFGIIGMSEIDKSTRDLGDGDIIVMTSDGLNTVSENMDWLKLILTDGGEPQLIADRIVDAVSRMSANRLKDDLTVLVAVVYRV